MNPHRQLFPEKAVAGYLNGASRSPQLNAVAAAARNALSWREEHPGMPIDNFFDDVAKIKSLFARLINCSQPERVAMTPAASYGIATVARNLPLASHQNIIVVEGQFPSNYYSWDVLCKERNAELRIVKRPAGDGHGSWSDHVIETIDKHTAAVAIAQLHWVDGTVYDLQAIRDRTDDVGAWLVIDGTQSLGAYPVDVQQLRPDALICGGYKWLMGPYGCGYAYFGPRMDNGRPLEENWINRAGSEDFRNLIDYRDDYRPLAGRYSTGQHSNFLMAPMQVAALQQVNAWTPELVQEHCAELWSSIASMLNRVGIEIPANRAHHLVGLTLPPHIDNDKLSVGIERRGLSVSYRGEVVRISPNVYNTKEDMGYLAEALAGAVL